jgi:hypothetical protein
MANEGYQEPIEELSDATRDMHRAVGPSFDKELRDYLFTDKKLAHR